MKSERRGGCQRVSVEAKKRNCRTKTPPPTAYVWASRVGKLRKGGGSTGLRKCVLEQRGGNSGAGGREVTPRKPGLPTTETGIPDWWDPLLERGAARQASHPKGAHHGVIGSTESQLNYGWLPQQQEASSCDKKKVDPGGEIA